MVQKEKGPARVLSLFYQQEILFRLSSQNCENSTPYCTA